MHRKGILFVVSGLSGAGKGTLCNLMLERFEDLELSTSATTRKPRSGELDGVNYHFITKEEFKKRILRDEYLEWAKVYNNYYGTPTSFVLEKLEQGSDVILEIDTQGAMKVKDRLPEGVYIFIIPPDLEEQRKRILLRGGENDASIRLRLKSARDEIKAAFNYDYLIVNSDLQKAAKKLESIIIAERCKTDRNQNLLKEEDENNDESFDRLTRKKI